MGLRNQKAWSSLGLLLIAGIGNSHAESFSIRDLNPLLAGFELPPALPSQLDSSLVIDGSYAASNITLNQIAGKEHLIADAETHRWTLRALRRIGTNWQLNIEIPYQSTSGGSLDAFIEHFHNAFNLPNGNRAEWPRNRLLIDYDAGNQSLFHLNNGSSGLSDSTARAGWQIDHSVSHSAVLWLSVKLPTGNAESLTGSGSLDTAVTVSSQQRLDGFRFFQQLSMSWFGDTKRLPTLQKHSAWSGVAGIDYQWTHAINLVAQLQAHSALYNSDIRMLGTATQLSIGSQYHSSHWLASFAITEDIAIDTAPDVQFQLNLARKF